MAMLYATLITRTAFTGYTIENVPDNLKPEVLAILEQSGLDGYGKPLKSN